MIAPDAFAGKVALVTGANSGIGRATALAFARSGASVVVANRRRETGLETVLQIEALGRSDAMHIEVDVSDEASVAAMIETTVKRFGRLDIAVNNAGNPGRYGRLVDQTLDDLSYTFDTNVRGVWLGMKYEIRQMLAQGGGIIVNTASNLAHIGEPTMTLYAASKSAVIGLTRAAALEYAREGIRINAVSPGPIETELAEQTAGSLDAFRVALAPKQPLGRVGQPAEVADVILWLSSDHASLINGQSILVDGGATLQ